MLRILDRYLLREVIFGWLATTLILWFVLITNRLVRHLARAAAGELPGDVILTLLAPVTQWITSTVITPEYFPNVIEHAVETGFYPSREEAEAQFNLRNYMVQSTIGTFVMGLVTSAVVAFFVRTKTKA